MHKKGKMVIRIYVSIPASTSADIPPADQILMDPGHKAMPT